MGKLVEIKTKATDSSVEDFINKLPTEQKRADAQVLIKLMEKATSEKPKMWGTSKIGFGNKRYKSPATGREVDWLKIGFTASKANFSLYPIDMQKNAAELKKLGKHKTTMGCLYINKLADVDLKVLEGIINESVK
jgi:hypothetical protein